MLFDANSLDRSLVDHVFDACVVGSGPAGVTLARTLAARGLEVALMEAGGLEMSPEVQDPYAGDIVGLDYFDPYVSRLRYFGGSSNHWRGRCRHLDDHDFEPQSHNNALGGWPIAKADLDPYAAGADEILELPPQARLPDEPVSGADGRLIHIQYRQSRPVVRFSEKYHDEIVASDRLYLVLHANLVDLQLDDSLGTVSGAIFKSYESGDPGFTLRARHYCLCLGGLENPRFLLNARNQIPVGIGNEHDLVGRFFCEHPHYHVADVLFENPLLNNTYYAPTRELLAEKEILNFSLRVASDKLSLSREAMRTAICSTSFTERLADMVIGFRIDCQRGGIGAYIERWQRSGGEALGEIHINSEQALNPDSRVLLTEARDDFGLRRLAVDWRLNELDYRSMRTAAMVLGEHMADQRIGRLRIRDWLLEENPTPPAVGEDLVGGYHHMCTTRMSADPRQGVVDHNCRVHGISNLYIGGSSVFGTPGHANPTYTIVQLALRLGDHLAEQQPA